MIRYVYQTKNVIQSRAFIVLEKLQKINSKIEPQDICTSLGSYKSSKS